jgi:hypothetical protein
MLWPYKRICMSGMLRHRKVLARCQEEEVWGTRVRVGERAGRCQQVEIEMNGIYSIRYEDRAVKQYKCGMLPHA